MSFAGKPYSAASTDRSPGRRRSKIGSGNMFGESPSPPTVRSFKSRRSSIRPNSRANSVPPNRRSSFAGHEHHLREEPNNRMMVSVRTRPLSQTENERGERCVVRAFCEDRIVRIHKEARQGAVLRSEMGAQHEYQFDKVFGAETTQEEVYEATTKGIVKETLKGVNCTVFAYGATGAGKTHTMLGSEQDPGIIPRALVDVFRGIRKIEEKEARHPPEDNMAREWRVKLSYLEVYNETIFDLLTENQKPLQPCEDPTDFKVKVLGLTEVCVTDVDQVLTLLKEGNMRRRMESTAANQVSSRSHAVLQVNVECTQTEILSPEMGRRRRPKKVISTSTLAMIDLAGSERAASTQNRGVRLREGANINKSLLALANCINALSSKKSSRVKYRDSKLTHLLKSSLEGNCCLSMIAAINPSNKCYEESHNTLKYANRAKDIKIKNSTVTGNRRTVSDSAEALRIEELEAENQELRCKLTRFSGSSQSNVPESIHHHEDDDNNDDAEENFNIPSAKERYDLRSPSPIPENDDEDDIILPAPPKCKSPMMERARARSTTTKNHNNNDTTDRDRLNQSVESMIEHQLQARMNALEIQNRTLANLAAAKFQVTPDHLLQVVQVAASLAYDEKDKELTRLHNEVEHKKKEIESLQSEVQKLHNDLEEASTQSKHSSSKKKLSTASAIKRAARKKVKKRQSLIPKPPSATTTYAKENASKHSNRAVPVRINESDSDDIHMGFGGDDDDMFSPKSSSCKKRLSSEMEPPPATRTKQKLDHIASSNASIPPPPPNHIAASPPAPPSANKVTPKSSSAKKGLPRLRFRLRSKQPR